MWAQSSRRAGREANCCDKWAGAGREASTQEQLLPSTGDTVG